MNMKHRLSKPLTVVSVVAMSSFLHVSADAEVAPFGPSYNMTGRPLEIEPNAAYSQWPLTVECRVKLDRNDGFNILLANETKRSPRHWELFTAPKSGVLRAYLPGFKPNLLDSGVSITDGQWHRLALVVEETKIQLFVDGELRQEQPVQAPAAPALGEALKLGELVEGGLDCAGQIDDVRISKCVREIAGSPDRPLVADGNTVGLWTFDDEKPLASSAYDLTRGPAEIPGNPAYSQWPLTVECRVKLDRKDQYNIVIANETKKSPRHWELFTVPESGVFRAYLPGFKPSLLDSGVSITDGQWHRLALVVEEKNIQLYVDGELKKEQPVDAPSAAASGEMLKIGGLVEGPFDCGGQIDAVRISKCVREIHGVQDQPFVADGNTVGLWTFDDVQGGVVQDKSPLKNNAAVPLGELFQTSLDLRRGLVKIPTAAMMGTDPLTIDCWMKFPKVNDRRQHQVIMAHGHQYDVPSSDFWRLDIIRGELRFYVPGQPVWTHKQMMDGAWHHLALVLDGTKMTLLVDGVECASQNVLKASGGTLAGCPLWEPAETLTVGGLPGGFLRENAGELGALRISKGIRTFDGAAMPPFKLDAETLGLWRFDGEEMESYPDAAGHCGSAVFETKPIGPATEYLALPAKQEAEPFRALTKDFSETLNLKTVHPEGIRDAVWQQWVFDYYWHDTFDYDRNASIDKEAVEQQVFDRQALVLPEDGGPAGTALRRTRALIDSLQQSVGKDTEKQAQLSQWSDDLNALCLANSALNTPQQKLACYFAACAIRRQAAFFNPLLDFDSILCVARGTYEGSVRSNPGTLDRQGGHFATQYFGFNALAGGGLYIVKNWKSDPEVVDILEHSVVENGRLKGQKLDHGAFCTPDLSYDGKQVVFAWTANPDHAWSFSEDRMFHLFKVNIDGSGLIQLTDGCFNDFDPCWLPGGRIAFVSERRGGYIRCFGAHDKVRNYTLFSMRDNGEDIIPLSYYETSEWNPSVNNDGMLAFTRWDYTDRENCLGSRFWLSGPDGTDPRTSHGNYPLPFHTFLDHKPWKIGPNGVEIDSRRGAPLVEMGIRAIPGSHKYIFTGAPHHGQIYGSLGMLDLRIDDDGHMSQVKRITPDEAFPESEFGMRGHYKYGTPWPLSEDVYLCNIWDNLALLDRFGNAEQICDLSLIPDLPDERLRLIDPIPLRARPRPPVIPSRTHQGAESGPDAPKATLAVMNIYDSDLPFPKDRKVKWLRIVQNILKTNHTMGRPMIGYEKENTPRIPLGIVPVEEDGSVYFEAPVAKELIFQPLDENFMAIQSMRSVAFVHPGEQLTCQGCHEPKNRPPVLNRVPLAVQRAPSNIQPEIGPIEPISYYRQIKPIFDNRCVGCHQKAGKGPVDMSYEALKDDTFWFAGGMSGTMTRFSYSGIHGGSRSIPGRFGASYCRLGQALLDETHREAVSEDDRHKIIVWLDSNSPRLGAYIREKEQLEGELVWPTLDVDPANVLGVEGEGPGLKRNFWHENLYGPHAFLAGSHELQSIYLMDEKGDIIWDCPAPNPQDVWMLPNGNVLVATLHAVREISRDKKVVWEYPVAEPDQTPTCQPLPNGNILIGIVGQCRLIEVNRNKEIVHSIQLETTVKTPHAQFRMCRQTPEGTYLVPFAAEGAVREYDRSGRMLREFPRRTQPICAVRLPDGNTLITADQCVTEYDSDNRVVWEITPEDVPDIQINILAGVQRLPNGNTLVCNWGKEQQVNADLFEITPDKRVVWQVRNDGLSNVAQCFLLTPDYTPRADITWR
jgi:hypothetical protein